MRDSGITVSGPFEVPDVEIDAYTDEDGTEIPAYRIDMSRNRMFVFQSWLCPCDVVHGYTTYFDWDLVLGYPELLDFIITSAITALLRAMDDCAKEMRR
jgi:hypothetical protein